MNDEEKRYIAVLAVKSLFVYVMIARSKQHTEGRVVLSIDFSISNTIGKV